MQEEVREFLADEKMEELADILEVLYALIVYKKFSLDELEMIRRRKIDEKGGFKKRIILEES